MGLGRTLRRAAPLLVMLFGIAAVGATQVDRLARWLEPAPPATDGSAVEPGATKDATRIAPQLPATRERRHSRGAASSPKEAPPDAEALPAQPDGEGSDSSSGRRSNFVQMTGDLSILDDLATLRASLDDGPDGEPAAAVEAGAPERLAITEYVETAEQVRGAVELIGERRPHLEEGVPVAITGRVVDKESGAPVANADVFLTSTFYVRSLQYDHHLREVGRVRTDAEGAFRVERLNADPAHFGEGGLVYVSVRSENHAPVQPVPLASVSPGYANRLDDIELEAESYQLSGRVVNWADKQPVAGARVLATGAIDPVAYPKDQRAVLFLGAPETVTDEDGQFVLRGLGAGDQFVSIHGGDDCIGRGRFRVPDSKRVEVQTLPIRGRIEGRILDDRGQPVPLALVQGGQNSTHSFADGRFVLENFVGDVIDVSVAHADYQTARLTKLPDGSKGVVARLDSRWPELRLAVRHLDTDAPVELVTVDLRFEDDKRAPVPASPHYLNDEGQHAVRIPAGVVSLSVQAAGFGPVTVSMHGHADGDVVPLLLAPAE